MVTAATPITNAVAKAERFADFLVEHLGRILDLESVEDMKAWGDVEWQRVADWMNELQPERTETLPVTSRPLIVTSLRHRLAPPSDVLAGLPR